MQKRSLLGEDRKDHFVGMWVNRNAKRKRPNDVLVSWKMFIDELYEKHGHKNATLIMHTDPYDQEGPNLYAAMEMLGVAEHVFISPERVEFHQMNILHNISTSVLRVRCAPHASRHAFTRSWMLVTRAFSGARLHQPPCRGAASRAHPTYKSSFSVVARASCLRITPSACESRCRTLANSRARSSF